MQLYLDNAYIFIALVLKKKKLYQRLTEALYVSGKLPTYPSPKLTFWPK